MRTHLTDSLWLASAGEEIRLIEHTGECVQALPLPDHAVTIAQHAMFLERALRLADVLEQLDVGISVDIEEDGIDVFVVRAPTGYVGLFNGHTVGGIPTASQAARLALGMPLPVDLVSDSGGWTQRRTRPWLWP